MYNLKTQKSIVDNYTAGLLPQRNDKDVFYKETSCRCNLTNFKLSSENRRILRKTEQFTFTVSPIYYDLEIQKKIFHWLKGLGWDFPISSVKNIFTNHIFNQLYTWKLDNEVIAYSVCYLDQTISHIAYVFYNPQYSHSDLPIRLVLQFVIDSHQLGLKYCYLGRFSSYKKNMPGFENYVNDQWNQ